LCLFVCEYASKNFAFNLEYLCAVLVYSSGAFLFAQILLFPSSKAGWRAIELAFCAI
jgi:hypothetical protein